MNDKYIETISVSPQRIPPEVTNTIDPFGSAIAEGRAYGEMFKAADKPRWVLITSGILIGVPSIIAFISSIEGAIELISNHHSFNEFMLSAMQLFVPFLVSGLALAGLTIATIHRLSQKNKN